MGLSFWDFVPVVGSIRNLGRAVDDFDNGKPSNGLMNLGFGLAGLTLDFCTLGTASMMTGAVKEGAKQGTIVIAEKVIQKGLQELGKEAIVYGTKGVASAVLNKMDMGTLFLLFFIYL